jgi:hypothetical protein
MIAKLYAVYPLWPVLQASTPEPRFRLVCEPGEQSYRRPDSAAIALDHSKLDEKGVHRGPCCQMPITLPPGSRKVATQRSPSG